MASLPPSARLRRAADFLALRKASGRRIGRCFKALWIASPANQCRLGLAVSRKVSKRAVERNRIKRIVRESFRVQRDTLPPLDVLVIARNEARDADRQRLRAELDDLWRTLQSLKPTSVRGTIGG